METAVHAQAAGEALEAVGDAVGSIEADPSGAWENT
jgi:hypothetical protein